LRAGQWSLTKYVITNQRILLIEGLVARRITALPLRLVIDTTYRRSMWGGSSAIATSSST